MLKVDFITLFPNQIRTFLEEGLFRIASEGKHVEYNVYNLRDWTEDKHSKVDDRPYGGGPGMLIKVEPVHKALLDLKTDKSTVIMPTPIGKVFTQNDASQLAEGAGDKHYIFLCGHYEGFDGRVHENLVDVEYSVGDFILSGGELPSLVIVDSVTRLIPGVLGNAISSLEESFSNDMLETPHFTRPENYQGWQVPEILLSGNHQEIDDWRKNQAKELTKKRRPDLLKKSVIIPR